MIINKRMPLAANRAIARHRIKVQDWDRCEGAHEQDIVAMLDTP